MPKSKLQKQTEVHELSQQLAQAKAVVFANFQGLTVAESEDLRNQCREAGVTMVAAKKTLVGRALEEAGLRDVPSKDFPGGIAAFFGLTDEVSPAKIVSTFAKGHEIMTIFGGVLEQAFISPAHVKNLATLPSKDELLSKLVWTLNAPVSGFVNVLAGNLRNLVNVLNNIKDAKA